MLVIFDCEYCVSYQLLKCVNGSVLWDGSINITKGTIYSFIHLLSSQPNIIHGENNCGNVSCKTSSCFESLNGQFNSAHINYYKYETLHFNSFGITDMTQFLSYISNKLYQQHNPGYIFYRRSIFYNTYIVCTHIEYSMRHIKWIP